MYCRKCGSQIDDNSRFCKSCGASISDDKNDASINRNHADLSKEKKYILGMGICSIIFILAGVISVYQIEVFGFSESTYSMISIYMGFQRKYTEFISVPTKILLCIPFCAWLLAFSEIIITFIRYKNKKAKAGYISRRAIIVSICMLAIYVIPYKMKPEIQLMTFGFIVLIGAVINLVLAFLYKKEADKNERKNNYSQDSKRRCIHCGQVFNAQEKYCPRCKTNGDDSPVI